MEVSVALLADYANISQEGKLNVMGIFDNVNVSTFPGGVAQCTLVVRFIADTSEKGTTQRISFRLREPDAGSLLFDVSANMEISSEGSPGPAGVDVLFPIAPLVFRAPGPHELEICVDEQPQRTIKIMANHHPQAML